MRSALKFTRFFCIASLACIAISAGEARADHTASVSVSSNGVDQLSFSGTVSWLSGDTSIQYAEAVLINVDTNGETPLGPISLNPSGPPNSLDYSGSVFSISGGKYKIKINLYDTEGGTILETVTSDSISIPGLPNN